MYSKNDYRYYLEHRLEESDDYLAHYGVKGMKWHKHKSGVKDWLKRQFSLNTPIAQNTKVVDNVQSKNKKMQSTGRDVNNILVGSIRRQNKPLNRVKRAISDRRKAGRPKVSSEPAVNSSNPIVRSAQKAASRTAYEKKKKQSGLKPKNQKVTVITDSKRKRSKKEAAWNNEMKGYAKEYLSGKSNSKKR